ncbi:choice-of-anchor I family protein [Corynebacterium breve]|uniref:Choice-of-anchor I family protein n=1 Tax=Corynebacterium breve TaxID=3049799 RepID=A0ABY8VHD6_9CORY|nr:choice-of-anchor I family protein [Corynebacterium breve]WIM66950.1 choice-of-anchor I family protein [Corynebacterium breve]
MSFSRRHGIAALAALATGFALVTPVQAAIVATPYEHSAPDAAVKLAPIGAYDSGVFDASAAEIVAYHAGSKRILTVNANSGQIDVLDASNPAKPTKIGAVSGGADTTINSVSVRADGLAVATVEPNADKTLPGSLMFFDAASDTFEQLGAVTVGSLPDMVTITEDGKYALVANEGEPAEDYSVDPEGSISVVALNDDVTASKQGDVRTADFKKFNGTLADKGVHIYGQVGDSKTEAQNIEPEYIAVDGDTAYASLQENNAIAVIDIETATVTDVWPLRYIDRTKVPFDASDRDEGITIKNWPFKSIRQPDSIGAYNVDGQTYIVTANEGDARDWEAYSEEARLKDLGKDGNPDLCEGFQGMTAEEIEFFKSDAGAGRQNITLAFGLNDEGTCYEEVYNYGGRSFSIFTAKGELVYESGSEFEEITAKAMPDWFNSNHTESKFEGRSDDKGPEPEGLVLGQIGDRTYAFIGFERVGGVIVYDITDPANSKFVTYLNNRDFGISMEDFEGDDAAIRENLPKAGDLGPEGLAFIPAADSPNGKNLVVVGNEVSGTTTVYQVDALNEAPAPGSSTSSALSSGSSVSSLSSAR